jgi:cysteine desulfurase/selenocysteine lyase
LQAGDTILASLLEHHSNLVVWQQVAKRTGCNLELVSLTSDGQLDLADLQQKLQQFSVKLISLVHVSNTTGAVLPVAEITKILDEVYQNSDRQKPRIVLDGAQSAPHLPINFSNLEVDFYAFSGHKMLGPMGIGGLLVRREILESGEMQPWLFGGGMISEVYSDHTIFHSDLSDRFTAGTPDVACAVGLAAACDYLSAIGMSNVLTHDQNLVEYALEKLSKIPQIHLIGPLTAKSENNHPNRLGSVAFLFEGVHAHDVAQVLDSVGVAVRSGHHCTMPLHLANNWVATTRASFQVYNSEEDIDTLIDGLSKVAQVFKNV